MVSEENNLTIPTLGQHMDLTQGTNQQPCRRHHGVYIIVTPLTTQSRPKQEMMV